MNLRVPGGIWHAIPALSLLAAGSQEVLLPIAAVNVVDDHTAGAAGVNEHAVLEMYAHMAAAAAAVGGGEEQEVALPKLFFADRRAERSAVLLCAAARQ